MKLSIVATLYQSAPYICEFQQRATVVAKQLVGEDYEIVLVNDGSPDNSLEIAIQLTERDSHVVVVDLSRNFGHHKAMMTGLMHACGERVFLIDCDLEEPPEVLEDWWVRLNENTNLDVIYGIQSSRKGGLFERFSGWMFYQIINSLSNVKLPVNTIVARLMTARYVRALIAHKDQEVYLFGLLAFTGFKQEAVEVVKQNKGTSTYTLQRRLALFLNAITSFTNSPLYIIFYVGISISALAFFAITFLMIKYFFYSGQGVVGWTSLVISIWAVGGFVLTALGVIGIYLAKIFSETKPRPYTIVRQVYGKQDGTLHSN